MATLRYGAAATPAPGDIRAGTPYEDVERMARRLGLTAPMLSHVLGTSERTLLRRRESGRLSAAESDRFWRLVRIAELAVSAFGGREAEAVAWLMTPKRALGGDTPVLHLDTEPGTRLVEQMLVTIDAVMPA